MCYIWGVLAILSSIIRLFYINAIVSFLFYPILYIYVSYMYFPHLWSGATLGWYYGITIIFYIFDTIFGLAVPVSPNDSWYKEAEAYKKKRDDYNSRWV